MRAVKATTLWTNGSEHAAAEAALGCLGNGAWGLATNRGSWGDCLHPSLPPSTPFLSSQLLLSSLSPNYPLSSICVRPRARPWTQPWLSTRSAAGASCWNSTDLIVLLLCWKSFRGVQDSSRFGPWQSFQPLLPPLSFWVLAVYVLALINYLQVYSLMLCLLHLANFCLSATTQCRCLILWESLPGSLKTRSGMKGNSRVAWNL